MRNTKFLLVSVLMLGAAAHAAADDAASSPGAAERSLQVEIQFPSADFTVEDGATSIEVEGIASAIGGVRFLDIIFVMDTSQSLRGSDPQDTGRWVPSAWSITSRRKATSRSASSASTAAVTSLSR